MVDTLLTDLSLHKKIPTVYFPRKERKKERKKENMTDLRNDPGTVTNSPILV